MTSGVSGGFRSFLRWWGSELDALLPRGDGRGRNRIVLSVESGRNRVILERSGQTETLTEWASLDDVSYALLARLVKARRSHLVGLRFPSGSCYSRTVELPSQAEGDYRRILDIDLERSTPFRSTDVLSAYHLPQDVPVPRGKRAVRQVIAKRRAVEPIIEAMRRNGIEPAFADCWDEDGRAGVPVNFLAAPPESGKARSFMSLAAVLAVALMISAMAIFVTRHQSALAALGERTAGARAKAGEIRQTVEATQTVSAQLEAMEQLMRTRLPTAAIIEELTVTLPDAAWVTDLRIDGDQVEMTGFAVSAASLIPLLEKSPRFSEVSLTSPVILDDNEDKERFSLRLRLASGWDNSAPVADGGTE